MSKMSRDKGARGERELCRILQARGYDAKRTFSQIDGDRADLFDAIPGYPIEGTHTERLELWTKLAQAAKAAGDEVPVLAFRRNRSRWHVALPLDDFLDLLESSYERNVA